MKKPLMKKPWGREDDDLSSAASSTSSDGACRDSTFHAQH